MLINKKMLTDEKILIDERMFINEKSSIYEKTVVCSRDDSRLICEEHKRVCSSTSAGTRSDFKLKPMSRPKSQSNHVNQ